MMYNVINKPKIFSVLIIFLLVFSLFSGLVNGLEIEVQNIDIGNSGEYIIELKDKPLFQYINSIKDRFVNNIIKKLEINKYKKTLLSSQESSKNRILSLFNEQIKESIIISDGFFGIFNGFCIKNLPESSIDTIKSLSFVKDVYPNYKLRIFIDESVPIIKASQVWDLYDTYGNKITGKGVKVAILDTGMDYNHPDLTDSYVTGYDFVNNDPYPMDDNGHGTHVAGIIAANGNSSNGKYVGVAPDVDLYIYKILDDNGDAGLDEYYAGIEAAIDPNDDGDPSDHVDIMSLSFGTEGPGSPDDPVSSKINEIVEDYGITAITAAGNSGSGQSTIASPGCALKSITVGSVHKNKEIAGSSSRGPVNLNGTLYIKPDLVAPGVDITSTDDGGGYISKSGTSMAVPHVAGAAALLFQVHPEWTPMMLKNELENNAQDLGNIGKDNTYGSGLIDIFKVINSTSSKPIAILNTPYSVEKGLINIIGTAMNSSGNPEDFVNYSLYYQYDNSWIKIHESNDEVNNGILCQWNTTDLENDIYRLKLHVVGRNTSNVVIKGIAVGYNIDRIIISAPSEITEGKTFDIKLINIEGDPVKAFVFVFMPFHIPILKYGSEFEITAPSIWRGQVEKVEAKIFVLKLDGLRTESENITILNH